MKITKKQSILLFVFLLIIFLSGCSSSPKESQFPKPEGFVNDYTGVLDAGTRSDLEAMVRSVESATSTEVAVAIVDSAQGMTVPQYANKLFEQWGVGKAGQDNGILLFVSLEDRELWIEVGYGLEGVITDLEAGIIVDEIILPFFREGRYSAGIYYGVAAISNEIYRESGMGGLDVQDLKGVESFGYQSPPSRSSSGGPPLFLYLCLPLFGIIILVIIVSSIFSRRCPRCKKLTLKTTRKVLQSATTIAPGRELITRVCSNCGYRDEKTKTIPRRSTSSSSWGGGSSGGSRSSGGFGGGRSGGGGAGGRW